MIGHQVEEKIARVSDILEQIDELNKLIEYQQENSAADSTVNQYDYMRREFIAELELILKEFKLKFPSIDIAA